MSRGCAEESAASIPQCPECKSKALNFTGRMTVCTSCGYVINDGNVLIEHQYVSGSQTSTGQYIRSMDGAYTGARVGTHMLRDMRRVRLSFTLPVSRSHTFLDCAAFLAAADCLLQRH